MLPRRLNRAGQPKMETTKRFEEEKTFFVVFVVPRPPGKAFRRIKTQTYTKGRAMPPPVYVPRHESFTF